MTKNSQQPIEKTVETAEAVESSANVYRVTLKLDRKYYAKLLYTALSNDLKPQEYIIMAIEEFNKKMGVINNDK